RRLKTANDIRRTSDSVSRIAHGDKIDSDGGRSEAHVECGSDDPLTLLSLAEESAVSVDAIRRAVRQLSPFEALVLGRLNGLWGHPEQSAWEIAWNTGRELSEIRRVKSRAIAKIRRHLISISHPIAESA